MARKKNRSRRNGKDEAGGEDHEMQKREEEAGEQNVVGDDTRSESPSFGESGHGKGGEEASNLESDAGGTEGQQVEEDGIEPKFGEGTEAKQEGPQSPGETGVPTSPSPSGWETPPGEQLEGSEQPEGEKAAAVDSETEEVGGGQFQEPQGLEDSGTSRVRSPSVDLISKEEGASQEEERGVSAPAPSAGKEAESPPAEEPNVPSRLASPARTPALEEKQEGSETPRQEVKVEPELRESRPAPSRSPSSTSGTPGQRRDRRQAQQDQRKLQGEKDEQARQQQWRQNQPPPQYRQHTPRQLQPTGSQSGPPQQFMAPYPERQQTQPQPQPQPPRGYGQQPQPLGNPLGQAGALLGNTLGQVMGGGGGGKETALQLRLDLNLDVDVQIKATVHGDVTLSLFQ